MSFMKKAGEFANRHPVKLALALGEALHQSPLGAAVERLSQNNTEQLALDEGRMTDRLRQGFETWRTVLNRMPVMARSGTTVKSVRVIQIPPPSFAGDKLDIKLPSSTLHVEITLSDGRVRQFEGFPEARDPGASAWSMDKWVIGALVATTPNIVRFAQESGE
ncbi:hypothetical protein KBB27_02245 [Patescibacteria group bacterium]|nr:hypothetical protein [Patescibacteria group bacterium]